MPVKRRISSSSLNSMPSPPPQSPISSSSISSPIISSPIPIKTISNLIEFEPQWYDMHVPPNELRITVSLATGQCFNWRPVTFRQKDKEQKQQEEESEMNIIWVGVLGHYVIALKETNSTTLYACLNEELLIKKNLHCYHNSHCQDRNIKKEEFPSSSSSSSKRKKTSTDNENNQVSKESISADVLLVLQDYFQLNVPLTPLYNEWSQQCNRIKTIGQYLPGLRILRQEPIECLLSFIISSNNNIARIGLILNRIRNEFGEPLLTLQSSTSTSNKDSTSTPTLMALDLKSELREDLHVEEEVEIEIDDVFLKNNKLKKNEMTINKSNSKRKIIKKEEEEEEDDENVVERRQIKDDVEVKKHKKVINQTSSKAIEDQAFYSFPTLERLATADETTLRSLGLGYRARFIQETVRVLLEKKNNNKKNKNDDNNDDDDGLNQWSLMNLRNPHQHSREDVQSELQTFVGVGHKVADCVALFSLDRQDIIPVDTHVWQIACRDLDPELIHQKSLTPAVYHRVGELFRNKFGVYAGWAHSLLFAAELPNFSKLLPQNMQDEMSSFKEEEKQRKAIKRAEAKERKELKKGSLK